MFAYDRMGAAVVLVVGFVLSLAAVLCDAGITSGYVRRRLTEDLTQNDMPLQSDVFKIPPGYNAPQQVHITQGDQVGKGVIVSWVTPDKPGSSTVVYWSENSTVKNKADGIVTQYTYFNYTSGYIHHTTITNLEYETKYYYKLGKGKSSRTFWFVTPPQLGPDVPYTFGLIGDLGQTFDSNTTLDHYEKNPSRGQTVLYVGDLSYADKHPNSDNVRWDTWGRFIERNAAYQPWIWSAGNHDIDYAPTLGEKVPFKPYTQRYPVAYEAANSSEPLWYCIKRASAHVIVMSTYSAFSKFTPQYKWVTAELEKVNRSETPWLIVVMHAPFYTSYVNHYMEMEDMRSTYESWLNRYQVDVVFAGHNHAYERFERVSNINNNLTNGLCTPVKNLSSPVYITIGDGGNLEGLDTKMKPQPSYSAFREPSYGHAIFDIKNRTHAYFSWHRNQNQNAVEADQTWLLNRYWCGPVDDSTGACTTVGSKLLAQNHM